MKALTITLIFFLLIQSFPGFSQKIIEYDFRKGNFTGNSEHKKISFGDFYKIKITNINTYCYGVKIESASQIDSSKYNFPTIASLNIDGISGLLSNLSSVSLTDISQLPIPSKINLDLFESNGNPDATNESSFFNNFSNKLFGNYDQQIEKLMNQQIQKLQVSEVKVKNSNNDIKNWEVKASKFSYNKDQLTFPITQFLASTPKESNITELIKAIESEKKKYEQDVMKYAKEIEKKEKFKNRHKEILNIYNKVLLSNLKDQQKFISAENVSKLIGYIARNRMIYEKEVIIKLESLLNDSLNIAQSKLAEIEILERLMDAPASDSMDFSNHNHSFEAKALHDAFINGRKTTQSFVKDILSSKLAYQKEMGKILQRMKSNEEIAGLHKEYETAYNLLNEAVKKQEQNLNSENWKTLHNRLTAISEHTNFEYTSKSFEYYGDSGWLKITTIPDTSRCPAKVNYNPIYHTFPEKQKSKFSTTSSFYISTLHDSIFSIRKNLIQNSNSGAIDTVFNAVDEENSRIEIGTGITMNYELCGSKNFHLSAAIGPAISFTKSVRLRLLTGLNCAFGQRHRFAIGLGAITGHVDRISKAVDLNKSFDVIPEKLTVSKLATSCYLNIGYQWRFNPS